VGLRTLKKKYLIKKKELGKFIIYCIPDWKNNSHIRKWAWRLDSTISLPKQERSPSENNK
jgi:hypothetical protein